MGPVAAALPGEATACSSKCVAGCREDGEFECYDEAGKWVATLMTDDNPCSQAQIDAWLQAYKAPCWRHQTFARLSDSPLKALLDPMRAQAPAP